MKKFLQMIGGNEMNDRILKKKLKQKVQYFSSIMLFCTEEEIYHLNKNGIHLYPITEISAGCDNADNSYDGITKITLYEMPLASRKISGRTFLILCDRFMNNYYMEIDSVKRILKKDGYLKCGCLKIDKVIFDRLFEGIPEYNIN